MKFDCSKGHRSSASQQIRKILRSKYLLPFRVGSLGNPKAQKSIEAQLGDNSQILRSRRFSEAGDATGAPGYKKALHQIKQPGRD